MACRRPPDCSNQFMGGEMSRLGYSRSEIDPCLYFKFLDSGFLYVDVPFDDMAAFASSQEILDEMFLADIAKMRVSCRGF